MALPININDLLNKQKIESNRIEFKKGWNPDKIYHSICAFANDFDNIGGGYILVGVEEENGIAKRPITGIAPDELDKIQKAMVGFNNKINPYYMPRIDVEEIDGKNILVIWCPTGSYRPYDVKESVITKLSISKWYIRCGTSSIEAKGEILNELRELANRIPFDDRGNSDITLDDINVPQNVPQNIVQENKTIQARILELIAHNANITREEMAQHIGVSKKTIQRELKKISSVHFVGPSKTGHWIIE